MIKKKGQITSNSLFRLCQQINLKEIERLKCSQLNIFFLVEDTLSKSSKFSFKNRDVESLYPSNIFIFKTQSLQKVCHKVSLVCCLLSAQIFTKRKVKVNNVTQRVNIRNMFPKAIPIQSSQLEYFGILFEHK
jgi:hypothetical protein